MTAASVHLRAVAQDTELVAANDRMTVGAPSGSARRQKRGPAPILEGRIRPCDVAVADTALRRFVEGMTTLGVSLLLEGALTQVPQPDDNPATNEAGRMAA